MNNDVAQCFRRAQEVLRTHAWCQGELARDETRMPVEPEAPTACSFCAEGALHRALADLDYPVHLNKLIDHCTNEIYGRPGSVEFTLWTWNDAEHRTKEDVLHLFSRVLGEST